MKIFILAGGKGTRLWPLSTTETPKQFLKIDGQYSFLQKTIYRSLMIVDPKDLFILTGHSYVQQVIEQIEGIDPLLVQNIIAEPESRNTAASIILGIRYLLDVIKADENELCFVTPSDHLITGDEAFVLCVNKAIQIASQGHIVVFGIPPDRIEPGFGYIKINTSAPLEEGYLVESFTEKPTYEVAKQYVDSGNYLWNSGMLAFQIKKMTGEMEKHGSPIVHSLLFSHYAEVQKKFSEFQNISIDDAILEKLQDAIVLPIDINWSDVGTWSSLCKVLPKDENGNFVKGNSLNMESENSIIFNNDDEKLVVSIGMDNVIIALTKDALLVSKIDMSEKVGQEKILQEIQNERERMEKTSISVCPWGSHHVIGEGQQYKIKMIVVDPGKRLSLQYHQHRSEYWVVVKGTAKVVNGDQESLLHEGESIYINKSTKHRIENVGKIPLEIIEVEIGEYLCEDDIVRLEDDYGRGGSNQGNKKIWR